MSDETELRYELKLTCDANMLPRARAWLRLNPTGFRTAHPTRIVNSLYFDTPDLVHLNANLTGVSQRAKLRLRWYGADSGMQIAPMLEYKFKRNLLGGKRRLALPTAINLNDTWSKILKSLRHQLPVSWHPAMLATTQPTLLTRYEREYYVSPDGSVRATIDYSQEAYGQRLTVRPNLRRRLPLDDTVVIELKAGPGEEDRLGELVAYFPLRRTRNSKYVNGVLAQF